MSDALRCPHCGKTDFDGDWCYNNGAYDIDQEHEVQCPGCREKFAFRPYQSVGYEVAERLEDL